MKQIYKVTSLILLLAAAIGQIHALAQPQPVILRLRGGVSTAGAGTDVQIAGSYAFVTSRSGTTNHQGTLEIFSVTNPSTPVRIGSYESGTAANAVQVVGHYAYLGEGTVRTITNDAGAFEIIDVSDPANPQRVGGTNTMGRVNSMRVEGNHVYLAESTRWTGTNLLGTLEIVDIGTPTNPVQVATFDTAGSATSVDVSGGFAYLADGVTDMQVIDVRDPANPQRVGTYKSDAASNDCGIEYRGPGTLIQVIDTFAYSAGISGLHVLDISDPSHPMSVGHTWCLPIYGFRVAGRHIYSTLWSQSANDFMLNVADASNPTNLTAVGFSEAWSMVFKVTDKWVCLARGGLLVYEITDRPAITSISLDYDWVVLTWEYSPGFVLQRTTSLDNPTWSDVPDSENTTSIILPLSSGNEFFRLARP
jgi:hypothetical protein